MKHVYLRTKVPVQGKDNEYCGPCGYGTGSTCYCFEEGGEPREPSGGSIYNDAKFKRTKACLQHEISDWISEYIPGDVPRRKG